ncbi:MAG: DUF692 domain-containing protein [Planctomycetes bacterium]|nr:DUF692 domain-containing protein [Planctomycetota bacterium]
MRPTLPQPVSLPTLGLGLRSAHFAQILGDRPSVGWFEALTENYLDTGGRPRAVLREVASRYPVALHGVALSIGSADRLDLTYLRRLRDLAEEIGAAYVSDHLSWSSIGGRPLHELLPIPYTERTLRHVVSRVKRVQDVLGRPFALENPSSYVAYRESRIPEAQFLARVALESGCGILLDINNIYVNSVNHGFDARSYLAEIPMERVVYCHMAGHTRYATHILDTHGGPVAEPVWELLGEAASRRADLPVLLEWDDAIPPFSVALQELRKAARYVRVNRRKKVVHAAA